MRSLLGIAAVVVALTVSVSAAGAASTFTVAGGPTGELVLRPGQPTSAVFTIVNDGDRPTTFRARITGLHFHDRDPQFVGTPSPGLIVTATPAEVLLGAHADTMITLTLTATSAAPGGRYAGVIFEAVPDVQTPGQATIIAAQARPLIGDVPGATSDGGRIVSFEVGPHSATGATFHLRFEDTGDVHYPLGGTMTVASGGRTLRAVVVPGQLMLPGEVRGVDLTVPGPLPSGPLRADLDVHWGAASAHRDTAHAETVIATSDANPPERTRRSSSFLADVHSPSRLIPTLAASLLLLLLLLALLVYWLQQRLEARYKAQ